MLTRLILCTLMFAAPAFAAESPTLASWSVQLDSADADKRMAAVKAIATFLDNEDLVVSSLVRASNDEIAAVRREALGTLANRNSGHVRADIAAAVKLRVLDSDSNVRAQAARMLVETFGSRAYAQLLDLLRDSDPRVSAIALESLRRIGTCPPECLPTLFTHFRDIGQGSPPVILQEFFRSGGPAAVDFALKATHNYDPKIRIGAFRLCSHLELTPRDTTSLWERFLGDPNPEVRACVLATAGEWPRSEPLRIAAIVRGVNDRDAAVQDAALNSLESFQPREQVSVPHLVKLVRHSQKEVPAAAFAALVRGMNEIEPPLQLGIAEWLSFAGDKDSAIRLWSWRLIQPHITGDDRLHAAWFKALDDPEDEVRTAACKIAPSLTMIDSENAIAKLVQRLRTDATLRVSAAKALVHFDPKGVRTVPFILDHLSTAADPEFQLLDVLPHFGMLGMQAIVSLASSEVPEITRKVAASLTTETPDGPKVAKTLMKSGDPETRALAMNKSLSFSKEVVQSFANIYLAAISDENATVAQAGWFCVRYVDPSPTVLRGLIDLLKSPSTEVRSNAATALIRLDKYPPAVAKALIDSAIIDRMEEPLRVIHLIGPDPRILPALLDRVKNDPEPSETLLAATVRCGREREDVALTIAARIDLEKRRGDAESVNNRFRLLSAIWWMGPGATKALPTLLGELDDPQPAIRRAAVAAISQIGAGAKSALPRLELRLNDPDPDVVSEARRAIAWIR